ncbi:MAG: response regulator [Armatimonadota bacterium]
MKILLIEYHQLLRECLREMFERQSGMHVVAEAGDGYTAMQLAELTQPDVALVEITLPGLNGIDLTRRLREITPKTRVIALSMHPERHFVDEMFRAGASAYLLKQTTFANLVQIIREVVSGHTTSAPSLAGTLTVDHYELKGARNPSVFSKLSARERQILQLIAEGATARTIADKLCISISTAETHRKHICAKLQLHNTAELTLYAIRAGLTPL